MPIVVPNCGECLGCGKIQVPIDATLAERVDLAAPYWNVLQRIRLNDAEETIDIFLHFPAGTDLGDVWAWFESRFGISVPGDLTRANPESAVPPRGRSYARVRLNRAV